MNDARLARAARLTEHLAYCLALNLAASWALIWAGARALRLAGLIP